MFVPLVKKVIDARDVFVERVLPVSGEITAREGVNIMPYDHVGRCDYSQRSMKFPSGFKPVNNRNTKKFYYYGKELGKNAGKMVSAPYNGTLVRLDDGTYEFNEETKHFTLLSGVWGTVEHIRSKSSVLLKTTTRDLCLAVSTKTTFAGELIVFPNPSHILEKFYLDEFTTGSAEGKIVYVGNTISMSLLKDAIKYGVGGLVGGSCDYATFSLAERSPISFGVFSGFGDIPTPDAVYDVLNNVTNRYVFFQGERNVLRIPVPPENEKPASNIVQGPLIEVTPGLTVAVLQNPYFGKTGVVDRVLESSIFVKFNVNENPVEVRMPNFFILG